MTVHTGPLLARIHPVTLGRLFGLRFGRRRRTGLVLDAPRYRQEVTEVVAQRFGVPLPRALDWLVTGAGHRAIPPSEMAAFLGCAFDLEPLADR